jgi:hypothetical protein
VGELHRRAAGQQLDPNIRGAVEGAFAVEEGEHAAVGRESRRAYGVGELRELFVADGKRPMPRKEETNRGDGGREPRDGGVSQRLRRRF